MSKLRICNLCHKNGGFDANHPDSGWNWYWEVTLCPECDATPEGRTALVNEMDRVSAYIEHQQKGRKTKEALRLCAHCGSAEHHESECDRNLPRGGNLIAELKKEIARLTEACIAWESLAQKQTAENSELRSELEALKSHHDSAR